jgi:hypothetical protein
VISASSQGISYFRESPVTKIVDVEVTLRLTVNQSVCLGIEHPCGTCDQILLPVGMLLSEICDLISMGRPLWREEWYAICSVITQWSESRRTRNHILLSHLRLLQPGGPGSHIYIPREQGGPVISPGTGFRVTSLLTVSQYVLVSSPLCGHLTRYCFLFKCLGPEFVVLSLRGALTDERPGLSFVKA